MSTDGLVKAIKAGKTEITVTTVDGSHVATCQVTVKEAPVKPVVLGVKDQSMDTIDISDTATLTLEVANAKTASYKLGNGPAVTFSNGQTITVGQSLAAGSSVTLTLAATSLDNHQSVTKTYTITKKSGGASRRAERGANYSNDNLFRQSRQLDRCLCLYV